mmetsp:Transcript_10565/g.36870  ORF Transcript_10565/g.36870 Transcript_10565/m.36870 type:complete len:224 (+) Transcript_10565:1085-1756(+)
MICSAPRSSSKPAAPIAGDTATGPPSDGASTLDADRLPLLAPVLLVSSREDEDALAACACLLSSLPSSERRRSAWLMSPSELPSSRCAAIAALTASNDAICARSFAFSRRRSRSRAAGSSSPPVQSGSAAMSMTPELAPEASPLDPAPVSAPPAAPLRSSVITGSIVSKARVRISACGGRSLSPGMRSRGKCRPCRLRNRSRAATSSSRSLASLSAIFSAVAR